MIRKVLIAVLALTAILSHPALAVEPDEMLADPVLEERARTISKQVRCVVCQNQDIDSSNAGVARDLRILVRERLVAGDSDQEVMDFLVARYGSYVLFKPPWMPSTYVLWLAPFMILAVGAIAITLVLVQNARRYRDSRTPAELDVDKAQNPPDYSLKGPKS